MTRIVIFDSGLGSLSIIRSIQKYGKYDIIYFADQKNYPYGKKSKLELSRIIKNTIKVITKKFDPTIIVVGSNTPTIILDIKNPKIFGVKPPIKQASKISKTKNIAILGTQSMIQSKALTNFIIKNKISKNVSIYKINCSGLVDLVESGDFLVRKTKSQKIIKQILAKIFKDKQIDVATLSSTHLPFLKKYFEAQFPHIQFLDPADTIAKNISKKIKPISKNKLKIYSTDTTRTFENNLRRLGIKNKIISF